MEGSQTDAVAVKGDALAVPNGFPKMLESLKKGVGILEQKLDAIDVKKEGAEIEAQDLVAKARDAGDLAASRLAEELKPYAPVVTTLRDRWQPLVKSFESIRTRAKAVATLALGERQKREEAVRREAQARLDAARKAEEEAAAKVRAAAVAPEQDQPSASAVAQGALAGSRTALREARAAVDALPPSGAPTGVVTPSGSLKPRKTWSFDVEDIRKVPAVYLGVDEGAVRDAIKAHDWDAGPLVIPGLTFREETTLVDRRPNKQQRLGIE